MSIYKTTIFTVLNQALKKETTIKKIVELNFLIQDKNDELTTVIQAKGEHGEIFEKMEKNESQSKMFLDKIKPYIKDAEKIKSLSITQKDGDKKIQVLYLSKNKEFKKIEL